jgi:DNA-binding NarL/FixJ family response regulator
MKQLRIILADDHAAVRKGLALLITGERDLIVVGEADNGKDALRLTKELTPDVVIVDLYMPKLNGLQLAELLKTECPTVKVLVLTAHEDESHLRQLCAAKVAGYVLKRSKAEELILAIHKVAADEFHFDAALASRTLVCFLGQTTAKIESHSSGLSEREKEVLRGVAWGYSNKELADLLSLSVKTVETYKIRVREKLGLRSRTEMVQYALLQGWMNDAGFSTRLSI